MPKTMSGMVAILNEDGTFRETRDLGPDPVGIKQQFVRKLEETRPPLSKGEVHGDPVIEVLATKVKITYPVVPEPVEEAASEYVLELERRISSLETRLQKLEGKK